MKYSILIVALSVLPALSQAANSKNFSLGNFYLSKIQFGKETELPIKNLPRVLEQVSRDRREVEFSYGTSFKEKDLECTFMHAKNVERDDEDYDLVSRWIDRSMRSSDFEENSDYITYKHSNSIAARFPTDSRIRKVTISTETVWNVSNVSSIPGGGFAMYLAANNPEHVELDLECRKGTPLDLFNYLQSNGAKMTDSSGAKLTSEPRSFVRQGGLNNLSGVNFGSPLPVRRAN